MAGLAGSQRNLTFSGLRENFPRPEFVCAGFGFRACGRMQLVKMYWGRVNFCGRAGPGRIAAPSLEVWGQKFVNFPPEIE